MIASCGHLMLVPACVACSDLNIFAWMPGISYSSNGVVQNQDADDFLLLH
jgi:hypothetical protein